MSNGSTTLFELARAMQWLGLSELHVHILRDAGKPTVYTASAQHGDAFLSHSETDLPTAIVGLLTLASPKI